jgi:hypothetical protein
MPITRSVWIDDDGSGTTGTVLNNAELQKIYNNIDALVGSSLAVRSFANGDTGTVNDWNPAGLTAAPSVIYWNGAGPLTITGIKGGVDGQMVTIRNRAAVDSAIISIPYFHTGSIPANRIITFATSAATPIAREGSMTLAYVAAAGFWVVISHEQGAWITPPFSAANFFGGLVVEAGDVALCRYRLSGRTVSFVWNFASCGITGSPTYAYVAKGAWGGFSQAMLDASGSHVYGDVAESGRIGPVVSGLNLGGNIALVRNGYLAWTNTATAMSSNGSAQFEVT